MCSVVHGFFVKMLNARQQKTRNLIFSFYIFLVLVSAGYCNATDTCPKEREPLRRLGDTRFYVVHGNERGNYVNQSDGHQVCKSFGLTMAKIENMRTFAIIGRTLEKLVASNKLKDTWYWLPAKYNYRYNYYEWEDNRAIVKYHNILYRKPRPTGVGSMVDYRNIYNITRNDSQCLAVALPWLGPWEVSPPYSLRGNQFVFEERPCDSVKKRHVICESKVSKCNSTVNGPFLLTEDKVDYFEKGNWIIGNRQFIINWEMRKQDDSRRFCENLKMELYQPREGDDALIPYIKMWSREVTMSTFWTLMSWDRTTEQYMFANRTRVSGRQWRDFFDENTGKVKRLIEPGKPAKSSRAGKYDTYFCVAMGLAYEFPGQTQCNEETLNQSKCSWHFREFTPSKCENYHATICVSKEKGRNSTWLPGYVNNIHAALNATATIPFGFVKNSFTRRSTYKQTFGSLVCPPDFHMLRRNNNNWSKKPYPDPPYPYDYLESYWVIDKDLFNKSNTSNCTVSIPKDRIGYERILVQVPCTQWHFYLCQKMPTRDRLKINKTVNSWKKMEWREGPQERTYPILSATLTESNS